jgi:hypothetical protein
MLMNRYGVTVRESSSGMQLHSGITVDNNMYCVVQKARIKI